MRVALSAMIGLMCLTCMDVAIAAPPGSEPDLVQPWWPCTAGNRIPTAEMAQLMVEHGKVFDEADRTFKAQPGTTREVVDASICRAEKDPQEAANLARVYGLKPGWTEFARKQEAAVIAYAALKARRAAEKVGAPTPGQSSWYTYNVGNTRCFESRSPADRIAEIQSRGHTARTEDYGDPSRPSKVDVIDDPGTGRTTVYTYWRTLQGCEAELPGNQPIAPKYR